MQPPGRSRSCAASGVAGAPDARSPARASSACVLSSSAAAQSARHLQLRSCTSGLATTIVMFVHVPQQVRQPADSHMQERTNWRQEVPVSGCCYTRSSCVVNTTPPAAKLHKWDCNNVCVMFE